MEHHTMWRQEDLPGETAEWLAKVEKARPVIEQYRDVAECERTTPQVVVDVLQELGLTRMWVSREFGGSGIGLHPGSAVLQELAGIDASIAWQVGVQGAIGRLSDYLPEAVAEELFRGSAGLIIGSVNPTGRAERIDGGYRLSGRWGFASGYAHADWLVCAAVVTEDGAPRRTAAGPDIRMLFVPRSATSPVDTWHTLGLRATGSVHYEIPDGVLVPDGYTVDGARLLCPPPERPTRGYPIAYHDFGPFTSASTALGVARAAMREFRELAGAKTPAGGTSSLARSHTAQGQLARAEIKVHSAGVLLAHSARQVEKHGSTGGHELSALVRLTAATVAEQSVAAVDAVYALAGSSSLYTESRLDRSFRDVHSATKHITLSPSHFETVGQFLLGGELLMRR